MLFRTRDFLLFLLTIAFLVVGIASTIGIDLSVAKQKAALITFNDLNSNEEVVYSAVLPEAPPDTRSSRLVELKNKVLTFLGTHDDVLQESAIEEVVVLESNDETPIAGGILLCPKYAKSNISWQPSGLEFSVVEGVRLLYRESAVVETIDINSTSTSSLATNRDIILQLPLRTTPSANRTCLTSDIVGIAQDGSLIRNSDHRLYQVFGDSSLVGYALDGFPIYGLSTKKTDSCGGAMVSGEYHYYLSADREGVLGCFSSTPTQLR